MWWIWLFGAEWNWKTCLLTELVLRLGSDHQRPLWLVNHTKKYCNSKKSYLCTFVTQSTTASVKSNFELNIQFNCKAYILVECTNVWSKAYRHGSLFLYYKCLLRNIWATKTTPYLVSFMVAINAGIYKGLMPCHQVWVWLASCLAQGRKDFHSDITSGRVHPDVWRLDEQHLLQFTG